MSLGTAIVVTSGKGGTGKTSLTGGVSSCLARLGKRVLCIDMDIGLRNLDLSLGMSDRVLMDFSDVMEGRCSLERAVAVHPELPNLFLLTAPMRLSPGMTPAAMTDLLNTAREQFDYILLDAPAGLGAGFQLAGCGADRAIVVATADAFSLRDAQRTVSELSHIPTAHLVVNRVRAKLLKQLRTTIDDTMDTAGLPLLGLVPEDREILLCTGTGRSPLPDGRRGAADAYLNIAKRIDGQSVPLMRLR